MGAGAAPGAYDDHLRVGALHLSVDLETLRTARDASAVTASSQAIHWSEDGEIGVTCVVEPAGATARSDAREANTARAWLEAYREDPGTWPDLPGVEAAGAIIDLRRGEVLAAVDRMGLHGMYWSRDRDQLRLASRATDALPATGERPDLDPAALHAYLYFHHVPSPLTVFRGVRKLPRAHALRCSTTDLSVKRYRLETFQDQVDRNVDALSQSLLETLRSAVSRSMDGHASVGAFLSGGLDSSTVAGLLAERLRPATGRSFSIGFDADDYDEMEYARIAARHFGLDSHEYYMTPDDVLAVTPALLRGTDEPFGNSSIAAAYQCALVAREAGITRMLAGDGGDELFAGNSRYAKQLLFERYFRLPAPLRRGIIERLLEPLGRSWPASVFGKAARYVAQANVPLPDRLQTYNYLHRHALSEVFTDRFLASRRR